MLDIEKAFITQGTSVYDFFQRPGVGLYIPLYQREYSWDKDNIDQLLDDITRGIERLCEEGDDDEIRFLGTIISVNEQNKKNIEPVDLKGLPSTIEKIIDGQQRLSTICLFATQLYLHIKTTNEKVKESSEIKKEIDEICKGWMDKLLDVISLDLKRGTPERKPQIIRGHDDKWIKDGDLNEAYQSDLSNHLAGFINYALGIDEKPPVLNKQKVGKNLRLIEKWLSKIVIAAHVNKDDDFLPAWDIIQKPGIQESLWQYERPELAELVMTKPEDKRADAYILCSLVQIFMVCHYLMERCCFTHITPSNDDWAFDMFQSLNASGTPLTAIETFKPLVVNTVEKQDANTRYKGSIADKSFEKVDDLFKNISNAAQKNKRTNEYLTSYAILIDAYKLTSHFSHQRKWLDKTYSDLVSFAEKQEYITFFGNYAEFYKKVWIDYQGQLDEPIEAIKSGAGANEASLGILFLIQSNHKMAATILGSFYSDIITGEENSINNFIEAAKALTAFYVLWRSAKGNSGLDQVYRNYFKGINEGSIVIEPNKWLKNKNNNVEILKSYLTSVLEEQVNIDNDELWINKASRYLNYKSKSIVKFLLLLTSHDTILDEENPGLVKIGNKGVVDYFNIKRWNSESLKSIEHVAPQTKTDEWDENLYDEDDYVQKIGNLTLLPININSSVGNKSWKEKHIYYQHLSEKDPSKLKELANKAKSNGISLNKDTISILQESDYNDHIKHIESLGEHGIWDKPLVEKRSERILRISHQRLLKWLK